MSSVAPSALAPSARVVGAALDQVRDAPFLLDAIRSADRVDAAAVGAGAASVEVLRAAALDPTDHVTAIAAVHGLARVLDDAADAVLSDLLSHDEAFLREHASWALSSRLPRLDAIGRLVDVVAAGSFAGMLAQRTLERWAVAAPDHVAVALEAAARVVPGDGQRARLVETLGVVPGELATRVLVATARDDALAVPIRAAAIAALGDRGRSDVLGVLGSTIARGDAELDAVVSLALIDARDAGASRAPSAGLAAAPTGPAVAQMFLHADLDPTMARIGTGDTGGIATLLTRLGDALVSRPGLDRVLTLSRGSSAAAVRSMDRLGSNDPGHAFVPVPLGASTDAAPAMSAAWPSRIAVERGLRRVLRHAGPIGAFHIRMADVGALAAQRVCRELGVPTVFTLAPDPHALVHALDTTGALTRDRFGEVDAVEHHWFRIRLVSRLSESADHTVLFPRPRLRDELEELLGWDMDASDRRCTVVPEGIDLGVADRAAAAVCDGSSPALVDLDDLIGALPTHRHGLPMLMTVGRLHRVKGMATVVEAWAADADLRERSNLVVVGGDLDRPDAHEQEQLARIAAVLERHPAAGDGLVLAGHRSHDTVAAWMAAVRHGSPAARGRVGPRGAYVCGSLKEEFGLALLEAMAAGNVVVAPHGGGPATYVEPGVTGVLVDTRAPREVAAGMAAALDMAERPVSGARATATVRARFSIETMAESLDAVYATVGPGARAGAAATAACAASTASPRDGRRA